MKKSIVISLLTVTTLFCTALCSFASTGIVTTDTLRLRKEPSTDSSTVALLSVNDEVEILEEQEGWYKIKSGENTGYVAAQYISVLTNTNQDDENLNKDTNNQDSNNADVNTNTEENAEIPEDKDPEDNQSVDNQVSAETTTVLVAGEKIYITPLINSLVLSTINEEKQIEVISEINGWSYIKMGVTAGWVRTENIQRKEVAKTTPEPENNQNNQNENNNTSSQKIGYISANSVNFRKTPSTSGEVITKLTRNVEVIVIAQGDGWTEIEFNGDKGYVSTEYVSDTKIETTSRGGVAPRTGNTNNAVEDNSSSVEEDTTSYSGGKSSGKVSGSDVVAYAKKYLGYRYVYGGSTPKSGFDCSGFTSYVYKHFGVSLSRTSSGQASNGKAVSKSSLQVGDVICFSSSSKSKRVGHVGIYIGNGKFIHAANSRKGVIISKVSGAGYYFVTARRVI